jgi:hypothetical protein
MNEFDQHRPVMALMGDCDAGRTGVSVLPIDGGHALLPPDGDGSIQRSSTDDSRSFRAAVVLGNAHQPVFAEAKR